MDQDTYEGLINRFEAEAENSPATFRFKVLLVSCAAYFMLCVIFIGSGLLIYFSFDQLYAKYHFVGLFLIGLFTLLISPVFFAVLRMLFMRLDPPEGRPITREEAPRLFQELDAIRAKLKGPPIHHVLIDRQFNAAIAQLPKWGLLGKHTNYLILGLPYLLGVTEEEMLSTVAHEYGHLCGNHGKFSAWLYRQRRTFGVLHEQVSAGAEDNVVHATIAGMLRYLAPYYNAYTFVLARQNEYEADLTASTLFGSETNASGLIRGELLGQWIQEEFWPRIYKQADYKIQPSFMPYSAMQKTFLICYDQWATRNRLTAAWREKSDFHDTHPSLRDRVKALDQPSKLPECVGTTAADVLLAPNTKQLVKEFDQDWWQREKKDWESRNRYVARSKVRLTELSAQPMDTLQLPDLQELALLKREFESPQTAKPVLEHLLNQPGGPFPKAAYLYGRILLDEDNDRGLHQLEVAAKNDQTLIESAARTGYNYLLNKRGEEAAEIWLEENFPNDEDTE